jgi:hypothetical protein
MVGSKTVKVMALDDGAGGIDFEVDGVKAKQAVLKLDKDSGNHSIAFQLSDRTGRGLQFDTADPIWVEEDCPCPPSQGLNTDQITVTARNKNRLETENANSGRERALRYQLNFIASDGSRAECDPIINNGGGIKPPTG